MIKTNLSSVYPQNQPYRSFLKEHFNLKMLTTPKKTQGKSNPRPTNQKKEKTHTTITAMNKHC